MRAQRPPEIVESALGLSAWLVAGRWPEGVEPQPADVGPPPLLIARTGPGKRLEPGERLATALDQPGGLVALARKASKVSSVKPLVVDVSMVPVALLLMIAYLFRRVARAARYAGIGRLIRLSHVIFQE